MSNKVKKNKIIDKDEAKKDIDGLPLIFTEEPSGFEIKEIDETNILYQYGIPVPSFDTWENEEEGRYHIDLNGEWKFSFENIEYQGVIFDRNAPFKYNDLLQNSKGIVDEWYSPLYNDDEWKSVNIPHVWDLEDNELKDWYDSSADFDANKAFKREFGWYRKTINISDEVIDNRYIRINALGIETQAWIFVNGVYVGAHESGYEAFSIDISQYLESGNNTIAIRVWRRPQRKSEDPDVSLAKLGTNKYYYNDVRGTVGPGGPFPYGGIKREIWIESTAKVSISKIITKAEDGYLDMYAILYNTDKTNRNVKLEFDPGTGDKKVYDSLEIKAGATRVIKKTLEISQAKEWNHEEANLYNAQVVLKEKDVLLDSLTVKYGMRKLEIKDGNLYLNGKRTLLKGFVFYEDFKPETVTARRETYEFHLDFIKNKLEANFLRGHPYHPKAKEVADENGMMFMEEELNNWLTASLMDYQLSEYRLSEAIIASKVWNNINHPSNIIWSLANELGNFESEEADKFIERLNEISKKLDIQQRPTTFCLRGHGQYTNSMAKHVDIYSFNTKRDDYSDTSSGEKAGNDNKEGDGLRYTLNQIVERHPDKPILFSEAGPSWTKEHGTINYNIFKLWDFILKEEYPVLGFAYWSYNDFKTGLGNFHGGGFTHSGIVKHNFNQEYMLEAEKRNEPYMVWLGHNFYKLYNPYKPETNNRISKHKTNDDSIWKGIDFVFDNIKRKNDQIKIPINLKTYDKRRVENYINQIIPLNNYWWLKEKEEEFSYPKDQKLKDVKVKLSINFYKLDSETWQHISSHNKISREILELGTEGKNIYFDFNLPDNNDSILKAEINVEALIDGLAIAQASFNQILEI